MGLNHSDNEGIFAERFTVYGTVQGVGFRAWTLRVASSLGITGSVQNLADGTVLIIAEGSKAHLDELHQQLETGPALSKVIRVHRTSLPVTTRRPDFVMIR
jgi:acylphosphatase